MHAMRSVGPIVRPFQIQNEVIAYLGHLVFKIIIIVFRYRKTTYYDITWMGGYSGYGRMVGVFLVERRDK